MLARKMFLVLGVLLFVVTGSSLSLISISGVSAASTIYLIVPGTPTLTPTSSRNDGRTTPASITSTPTLKSEFQLYRIQTGDNIYLIAQKVYGDSSKYALILSANNLNENSRLLAGMVLKIPVRATPTATLTLSPTWTVSVALPAVTSTLVPTPSRLVADQGEPIAGVPPVDSEQVAIMAMLTTFATSTLIGSTIICGFLAFVIYSSARRMSRQQAMARRVRPPLVH